jgi:hypothetical protein
MRKVLTMLAALAVPLLALTVVVPATSAGAASSKLWVSSTGTLATAPGKSCAKPGYRTIQSAIAVAGNHGATIEVCTGTYTEQLTITNSVSLVASGGPVTVVLPATPADATTTCDLAVNSAYSTTDQDGISICGPVTVGLTGITVQADWPAAPNCEPSLNGIEVGGGADLSATNVAVTGAGADPINGCQQGIGINIGTTGLSPASAGVGVATLKTVTVSGYQKNGITVDGAGSSATITGATITGAGATTQIAQNGIQISDGALGVIKSSTISGNVCNYPGACGPDSLTESQAIGVLFYGAASGSSLSNSTLQGNDAGTYYISESPTEPHASEVVINKNTFTNNRYEGVDLDQGIATVTNNTINGTGNAGIQTLQYHGQSYAPASTASRDTISGQGIGVQVLSDNAAGDFPGTFTISNSSFVSGNTVGSEDNSSNFTIGGRGNR